MPDYFATKNLAFARNNKLLFQDITLQQQPHGLLHVQGNNGSGKTTLLRVLAGLLPPLTGEIFWNDQNITNAKENYNYHMHYQGHNLGLKLDLTVRENFLLFTTLAGLLLSDTQLEETLTQLELNHLVTKSVQQLSAGQQQRIALAKLILIPKKLWLLDEPFASLDQFACRILEAMFLKHLQAGGMIIFTSHQPFSIDYPTLTLNL